MVVREKIEPFFKNKRVLITGDTGFKGSWIALWLHKLGADVLGYALPPKNKDDHYCLLGLDSVIKHVDGDIRDYQHLKEVFDDFKPEILFHLAAQALVRDSYSDPKYTFDTNIAGSVNILEMVRMSKSLKSVVYVTSDKCYKNKEWIWGYRENDELGGHDPYSASKAAAEMVFSSYSDSFFFKNSNLGVGTVRAGNVIGGGDWSKDRIIPDCMRALQNSSPIFLRNPYSTRPWQHVLEPLSGYVFLSMQLYNEPVKYRGAWNFGPKAESIKTVEALSEKIIESWGSGELKVNRESDGLHEAGLLHLNCDKASQILGWTPKWGFERSIFETVKWYKDVYKGSNAFDVTNKQIDDYMEA